MGRKPIFARALTTHDKQRKRHAQFKMMMDFINEVRSGIYGNEAAIAAERVFAEIKEPTLGVIDAFKEDGTS